MIERVGKWCFLRRRFVLAAWVLLLVGSTVLAQVAGGDLVKSLRLPGTESQQAFDVLGQRFPARAGDVGRIVIHADNGVAVGDAQAATTALFDQVSKVPHVIGVASPFVAGGDRQVSKDGKTAYAEVQFDLQSNDIPLTSIDTIVSDVDAIKLPGTKVDLGGTMFETAKPGPSELIGIIAAIVILLVAFGSLIAMGLPIMTALFGIGIGLAVLELFANVLTVPDFATQVAAMIAIGVGIDYALFIVTRNREALHAGSSPDEAIDEAMGTAGRSVLFAGGTVVISLLGMFLVGLGFIRGMAVGASAAVLLTMLASLTLLPAVLGFAGTKIDRFVVGRKRAGVRDPKRTWAYRWSRAVQHHPVRALFAALIPLVVLTVPLFSLRLGSADAGANPTSDTTRRAYDLLSEGFGPGFNGPLLLAAEVPAGNAATALAPLVARLQTEPGVASVSPPQANPDGTAAIISVVPTTGPQDAKTSSLIRELRGTVVPSTIAPGSGVDVFVGGQTAAFDDLTTKISGRLPWFIGAVLVLSFILLMAVFRSVLVPLKAVIMNLLSIGAAYGLMVAVFQWGWLKDVFGVAKSGPVESWIPMMMFAIVFGLSMDYEVFLLSRIREEYDRSGDNATAVADGLAGTARLITAAAAIMICVFGSFILGDLRPLKMIGFGLATAVLIDATLVRMVLVPATMELLGDRNWWLPSWLDKVLPRINVERHHEPSPVSTSAPAPVG
jgi:RND superfamily putative drug exporter